MRGGELTYNARSLLAAIVRTGEDGSTVDANAWAPELWLLERRGLVETVASGAAWAVRATAAGRELVMGWQP